MAKRKRKKTSRGGRRARRTNAEEPPPALPSAPARALQAPPAEPAAARIEATSVTPAATATQPSSRTSSAKRARQATSLSQVFESLAGILVPYARLFESEMHPRMGYCLKAKYGERPVKELYFGGVRLHQDHASFHLFLLYSYPDLEEGLSPGLRQRLEGKTCFRIERSDGALIDELDALTRTCYERFRSEGLYGRTAV